MSLLPSAFGLKTLFVKGDVACFSDSSDYWKRCTMEEFANRLFSGAIQGTGMPAILNGTLAVTGLATFSAGVKVAEDGTPTLLMSDLGAAGGGIIKWTGSDEATDLGEMFFDATKSWTLKVNGSTQALKIASDLSAVFAGDISAEKGSFSKSLGYPLSSRLAKSNQDLAGSGNLSFTLRLYDSGVNRKPFFIRATMNAVYADGNFPTNASERWTGYLIGGSTANATVWDQQGGHADFTSSVNFVSHADGVTEFLIYYSSARDGLIIDIEVSSYEGIESLT